MSYTGTEPQSSSTFRRRSAKETEAVVTEVRGKAEECGVPERQRKEWSV